MLSSILSRTPNFSKYGNAEAPYVSFSCVCVNRSEGMLTAATCIPFGHRMITRGPAHKRKKPSEISPRTVISCNSAPVSESGQRNPVPDRKSMQRLT
ncbi:hypothetical protein TNCV_3100841 [Trichonephila clavipes]|nr:hypothetical protein TNCV_3100841 [Trichonephila clavipes]